MADGVVRWTLLTSSVFLLYVILVTEARLTDTCSSHTSCIDSVPNSFCNGQTCVCRPGFVAKGKAKCKRVLIGDACSNSTDCTVIIPNSICLNGKCACESGHKPRNENNRVCDPTGEKCRVDSDCSDVMPDSVCVQKVCTCRSGYLQKGDKCEARKIGSQCVSKEDCATVMNNTDCINQVCQCALGYVNEDADSCRPRKLDESCVENSDCESAVEHSKCSKKGVCECQLGFLSKSRNGDSKCVRLKLGDSCKRDNQCTSAVSGSKCQRRKCVCKSDLIPNSDNTECQPIRRLGDTCNDDNDCKAVLDSECVQKKCTCKTGFKQFLINGDAHPSCLANLIGDSCLSDEDCPVLDSFCDGQVCSCKEDFVATDESRQCSPRNLWEIECLTDAECLLIFNNSVCSDTGLCKCDEGYIEDASGSSCGFKPIGEPCFDSNCFYAVDNVMCRDGLCLCEDTHIVSEDNLHCDVRRIGGMTCDSDLLCSSVVPNSFCNTTNSSNKCVCNIGFYANDRFERCLPRHLDDPCDVDQDCSALTPNSACFLETKTCACQPGYSIETGSSKTSVCEKRKIGHHVCESDQDCLASVSNSNCGTCEETPPDSVCRQRCQTSTTSNETLVDFDCETKTCLCDVGYYSIDEGTKCRGRELRDKCEKNEDCSGSIPNSLCLERRNICHCQSGFMGVSRNQCKRRTIGDTCYRDSDCEDAVTNSFCDLANGRRNQGKCVCVSGYRVDNASSECRRRQIGDDTCMLDTDCSDAINGSRCHNRMCVCLLGYQVTPDLYNCEKRSLRDEFCSADVHCSKAIPHSLCRNFKCVCVSGFYGKNDSHCERRKIGDTNCMVDEDCQDAVNNSACISRRCQCVSGFQASPDNSTCKRRRLNESICKIRTDCSDAVSNSSCRNERCVCDSGFYQDKDRTECIKRKIDDVCDLTTDCNDVIDHSLCKDGLCACREMYDAHNNNSICVRRPSQIGAVCHFTQQCQKIDPTSTCNLTHGDISTCVCPDHTFINADRKACVNLPSVIGDLCSYTSQCTQKIPNSDCDRASSTCLCMNGYFPGTNMTICHPVPGQLFDYCLEDSHCSGTINMSKCEKENNTCVCQYGFKQRTKATCVERDRLPSYRPISPPTLDCQGMSNDSTSNKCVEHADRTCHCDCRHAHRYNDSKCVPVQTYQLTLKITQEASTYDYVPLMYRTKYASPTLEAFVRLADRITLSGIMKIFENSPMRARYVSSDVISIQNLDESKKRKDKGVKASILVHLTAHYLNATPIDTIHRLMEAHLNSTEGNLGDSRLRIQTPYSSGIQLSDYDECEAHNDCHKQATCINTLGSYMCFCKFGYQDKSKSMNKLRGRECSIPSTGDEHSDLCSSDDCETRWEFVALALTLFLLIIMSFITYEIIQRKQDFSARKLYEKFGTTKIRKLKRASMRRMQENKKKKMEENKKKKEENKKKKEEQKKVKEEDKMQKEAAKMEKKLQEKETKKTKKKKGKKEEDNDRLEEESDNDEAAPPTPPLEIMHPPSFPFMEIENVHVEPSDLPGSVNRLPEFQHRIVSPIEESPV